MANYFTIVAIGDSITYGFPYMPSFSWVHIAEEKLGVSMINRGVDGDTTAGMLARFDRDVLRSKPSHALIMGGSNDAFNEIPLEEVANNIRHMVELALHNEIIPVIGLPIPCDSLVEERLLGEYRKAILRYADNTHVAVIDFYRAMVEEKGMKLKADLQVDGIHPNKEGYRVMAGVAIQALRQLLAL